MFRVDERCTTRENGKDARSLESHRAEDDLRNSGERGVHCAPMQGDIRLACVLATAVAIGAGMGCTNEFAGAFDTSAHPGFPAQDAGATGAGAGAGADAGAGAGADAGAGAGADAGASADAGAGADAGAHADAGSGGGDAGGDGGGAIACINPSANLPNGQHNAGLDCMQCHNGTTAVRWTLAGTLYDSPSGNAAVSGATIEIVDANGQKLDLVTASNGNFYTQSAVAFPISVRASRCPSDQHMASKPTQGGCNASSCHNSTMRVHLP
jgi:hypothetical protein